jgi:hypothetical protein
MIGGLLVASGVASEASPTTSVRVQSIMAGASAKVDTRLATLDRLATTVRSSASLSSSDKAYLSDEISNEISGLSGLQTKLAADTNVAQASADADSVLSGYRVYTLVVPKVRLVSMADHQQHVEATLRSRAQTLQSMITADTSAGTDVSSEQTALDKVLSQISIAEWFSASLENRVLLLQPSDWNAHHDTLTGDRAALITLHAQNLSSASKLDSIARLLQLVPHGKK